MQTFLAKQILLKINRIARIWHFEREQFVNSRMLGFFISSSMSHTCQNYLVTGSIEVCACVSILFNTN